MPTFVVGTTPVPDWRNGPGMPARPMNDQLGDVLEQFDDEKDMLSIGALTQGLRWIDEVCDKNDTIDAKEWQAVSRAMRAALGEGQPIEGRAQRLVQAFAREASLLSAMAEGAARAMGS